MKLHDVCPSVESVSSRPMTDESKRYEVHLTDHVGVTDELQVSVTLPPGEC